jgi:hypothetical protein
MGILYHAWGRDGDLVRPDGDPRRRVTGLGHELLHASSRQLRQAGRSIAGPF